MPILYSLENPSSWTPTTVTVGATSTLISAANNSRIFILIVNTSSEVIYINIGAAATTASIPIYPQGVLQLSLADKTNTVDAIYGICSSGGKTVNVFEGV